MCTAIASASALFAEASLAWKAPDPVTVLRGLDPVSLASGTEQAGVDSLSVVHGCFRYLFSTSSHRDLFVRKPEAFAVQMGGACGRMGPMSGLGDPDRFLVHEGRIYLFASSACSTRFAANPEAFEVSADPPASGTPEELARGRELIEAAVEAMGGAARLDVVQSYRVRTKIVYQPASDANTGYHEATISFPDRYQVTDEWGSWSGAFGASPRAAYRREGEDVWPVDEQVKASLIRSMHRNSLALLKRRNDPGFRAAVQGRARVGEIDVETALVSVEGTTCLLSIDLVSGRLLELSYESRPDGVAIRTAHRYSDFRDVKGVELPFTVEKWVDGDRVSNPVTTFEAIEIDVDVEPTLFEPNVALPSLQR